MVHDWGGPIGLGVAARHPDRFQGLIIGNTFAWPLAGDPSFERFSRIMGGAIGRFLVNDFNAFVNVLVPAGVERRKLSREVMDAYRRPFAPGATRAPMHIFPRELLRSRAYLSEVEIGLQRLRHLPALILWGDRDIAFKAPMRERFERTFPDHRTVILRGAGHYIQEDAAEEIVGAIRSWWEAIGDHD